MFLKNISRYKCFQELKRLKNTTRWHTPQILKFRSFHSNQFQLYTFCVFFTLFLFVCHVYFTNVRQIEAKRLARVFHTIQERNLNMSHSPRVVFCRADSWGYGNRVYVFLSSFSIALLTESALIIRWPNIKDYIEEPFMMAFDDGFTRESPFNYEHNSSSILVLKAFTNNTWIKNKTVLANLDSMRIPLNYTRYTLAYINAYFFDLFQIREYADKLVKYGYVRAKTVRRAFEQLEDKSVAEPEKLESLNMIGYEFAGNALNRHWNLKIHLLNKINSIVEKHFKDSFVIGKKKEVL